MKRLMQLVISATLVQCGIAYAELPIALEDDSSYASTRCVEVLSRNGSERICTTNYLCVMSNGEVGEGRMGHVITTDDFGRQELAQVSICENRSGTLAEYSEY